MNKRPEAPSAGTGPDAPDRGGCNTSGATNCLLAAAADSQ